MRLPSIFTEGLFDDWMNDNGLMNPPRFLAEAITHCMANMRPTL